MKKIYDLLSEIEMKVEEIRVLAEEMREPIGNLPATPF